MSAATMSSEGENTHTPAAGPDDGKLPASLLLSLLPLVVALLEPLVAPAAAAAAEGSSKIAREKPSVAAAAAVAGCGDCPTQ